MGHSKLIRPSSGLLSGIMSEINEQTRLFQRPTLPRITKMKTHHAHVCRVHPHSHVSVCAHTTKNTYCTGEDVNMCYPKIITLGSLTAVYDCWSIEENRR